MKSHHASWETPDPGFWTSKGYIAVRADELGAGQSPGLLDTMSRGTSEAFFDVVEWCSEQEWSSGKVGLLGISYYAGTQWRVAARKPKGLAAMIPWEGMSDYYRDRVRHGGILSDKFISESGPVVITKEQFANENGHEQNFGGKMAFRRTSTGSPAAPPEIGVTIPSTVTWMKTPFDRTDEIRLWIPRYTDFATKNTIGLGILM